MSFVTKDSGERQTFATGMQRDTTKGKLRIDLVYMPLLVRWGELMGRGAEKYGERNWEKARTQEELDRFKESAIRHFFQWFLGLNPEEDHAAAVLFNIAGAEHVKARMQEDVDRYRELDKALSLKDPRKGPPITPLDDGKTPFLGVDRTDATSACGISGCDLCKQRALDADPDSERFVTADDVRRSGAV